MDAGRVVALLAAVIIVGIGTILMARSVMGQEVQYAEDGAKGSLYAMETRTLDGEDSRSGRRRSWEFGFWATCRSTWTWTVRRCGRGPSSSSSTGIALNFARLDAAEPPGTPAVLAFLDRGRRRSAVAVAVGAVE